MQNNWDTIYIRTIVHMYHSTLALPLPCIAYREIGLYIRTQPSINQLS
jgi:hypothetical protein